MNNIHPRERLVRTAATLVHHQGWTITGINQILTEAGIPKGSFYYYFRSKEALGVAVLQHHYNCIKELLERTLTNEALTPDAAIYAFLSEVVSGKLAAEFRYGCPAGNLANEIATQCPALLTEANRALDLYRDSWTSLIRRAQRDGLTESDTPPAELGEAANMLIQGAFLVAKCKNSTAALELAHSTVHRLLFGQAQSKSLSLAASAHDGRSSTAAMQPALAS